MYVTNLVAKVKMSSDIVAWLREFDACCAANGWKVSEGRDDKIQKLPAFLRGQAASHFYVIPEERRRTYADAATELKKAMCPEAQRENFYAEFESRVLRSFAQERIQLYVAGS